VQEMKSCRQERRARRLSSSDDFLMIVVVEGDAMVSLLFVLGQ